MFYSILEESLSSGRLAFYLDHWSNEIAPQVGVMATALVGGSSGSGVGVSATTSSGTLEGTLSKWTNVMKGWQYRFFVLDENAGLLSYYTVCVISLMFNICFYIIFIQFHLIYYLCYYFIVQRKNDEGREAWLCPFKGCRHWYR